MSGMRRAVGTCGLARVTRGSALALAIASLAGCAAAPVWIDYEISGRLATSRGEYLYRVQTLGVGAVYVKPAVWFSDYARVALRPVTLRYRAPPSMPSVLDRTLGNYLLTLDASDRLERELGEALRRELRGAGRFQVLPEPTTGALLIAPHVVDLRWEAPPAQGGESLYVHRSGSMTLVVDVRDAGSGALLARVADARDIRPDDVGLSGGYEASPVNNEAGVRDVCAHWGRVVSATLERLYHLPPLPAP